MMEINNPFIVDTLNICNRKIITGEKAMEWLKNNSETFFPNYNYEREFDVAYNVVMVDTNISNGKIMAHVGNKKCWYDREKDCRKECGAMGTNGCQVEKTPFFEELKKKYPKITTKEE